MSVNKIILIGRLGADPEYTVFDNGSKRVLFGLATNDYYKNKDGKVVSETDWHNIIAWGKMADIVKDLKKGYQVYIEGKIKYLKYVDKDGENRTKTQIQIDIFRKLSVPDKNTEDIEDHSNSDSSNDLPF